MNTKWCALAIEFGQNKKICMKHKNYVIVDMFLFISENLKML